MPNLTDAEWMIVIAAMLGPVLGVQTQKWLERLRESRGRKLHIFYALMGTRAARVSPDHVRALNQIDLEFYGRKILWFFRYQLPSEKNVVDAWRIYLDHLNTPTNAQGQPPQGLEVWASQSENHFTELLFRISTALGFDFDRVHLKRGIYNPKAHDENEQAGLLIRNGVTRLLYGLQPLRVALVEPPAAAPAAVPAAPAPQGGGG